MQKTLIASIALFLALGTTLSAQFTCDNSAVAKFASMMNEQQLIEAIGKAPACTFDLKPSAVKTLKATSPHITDAVITAMEQKADSSAPQQTAQAVPSGMPSMPMRPEAYIYENTSSSSKLLKSEESDREGNANKVAWARALGGPVGFFGVKNSQSNVIRGLTAPTQVGTGDVRIEIKNAPAGAEGLVTLIRLVEKNGNREINSSKSFGMTSLHKAKKDVVEITTSQNGGTITVKPAAPLEGGHYMLLGNGIFNWTFDVSEKQQISQN